MEPNGLPGESRVALCRHVPHQEGARSRTWHDGRDAAETGGGLLTGNIPNDKEAEPSTAGADLQSVPLVYNNIFYPHEGFVQ